MRILVIEHFAGNLDGKDNDRFVYLCKMLAVNPDNKVELITSSFNHEKKCKKERRGLLSSSNIIRLRPQYRETDYQGFYIHAKPKRHPQATGEGGPEVRNGAGGQAEKRRKL